MIAPCGLPPAFIDNRETFMKLIIVESPTKAKKIQAMLGEGYRVMASMGHIRDLPDNAVGVYPPDYAPDYVLTDSGKKTVPGLKDAAKKAEAVYLASDPDREGEAIGWHLSEVLKLKNRLRVVYHEITESALKKALASPRPLDMNLVRAQEARRVIDRLVGYRVSSALAGVIGVPGASSGRVQTPALLLLVQRELAIRSFVPVKHYGCDFIFADWKAAWDTKNFLAPDTQYILDRALAQKISATQSFTVRKFAETERRQGPPPPFITSTLQRAGEKALNVTIKDVMAYAQKLFEGGHITYMRTDSPNLAQEAVAAIRAYCAKQAMPLVEKPRTWKAKDSAQAAHEAIRPTHIEIEEAGENEGERGLYRLIRMRTIATQLADAVYAVRSAELHGPAVDGRPIILKASGRKKIAPGWTAIMEAAAEDEPDPESEDEAGNPIPKLAEGATLTPVKSLIRDKQTAPPGRFTESSLVETLEKQGVGRPSTYAATLERLYGTKIAVLQKKIITPTALGEKFIAALEGRFKFVDLKFTQTLENLLDEIAAGKEDHVKFVAAFDAKLDKELQGFVEHMQYEKCPLCGAYLKPITAQYKACTSYHCAPQFPCPECGRATQYGKSLKAAFLSCIHYPECKGSYTMANGVFTPAKPKK
jgi:DNA topoisomerase-1